MRTFTTGAKILIAAAAAALVACSQPASKTYSGGDDTDDSGANGSIGSVSLGGRASGELVTIPVEFVNRQAGLSLLGNATTYTISLENCKTGYQSTANEQSTALQVYKFDRDCVGELTTFEYNGHTYLPTAGHPFTTWIAGDAAVYDEAGEPGTNAVNVKVISQLDAVVSGNEAIVYQFSELKKGADDAILEAEVGAAHSLTVNSQPPPSFTIAATRFVGVNATGGGQFEFTLECTSDIAADTCEGVNLSDLKYDLVEDTFTADTLVIGEAVGVFTAAAPAPQPTTVTVPGDEVAIGAGGTAHGGFVTVTLDGPDAMATGNHPHMIFIIEAAGVSYQYFNVDVATLTQD